MNKTKTKNDLLTVEEMKLIRLDFYPKSAHAFCGIAVNDDHTRIDFYYRSPYKYVNGGWITMEPSAYIQVVGSEVKYPLIGADNIPLAPERHYFRQSGEHHYYSLFFPPIPKNTKKIHIIEKEAPGNFFNFYGVEVNQGVIKVNETISMN